MKLDLRRLLRLPLIIYLASVLCSCLVCYALVYSLVGAHQSGNHPDYLRLETEHLEMEFPRKWLALQWGKSNESGSFCGVELVELAATNARASFSMLDDSATQYFLTRYGLLNALSVVNFAAQRTFEGILTRSPNATFHSLRNGTTTVSGLGASYTVITIRGVLDEDGVSHNVTGTFIAASYQQGMACFSLYSLEEAWEESSLTLQTILDSTTIRR